MNLEAQHLSANTGAPNSVKGKKLPYRPCVGIMLLNAENNVFVGRRIGSNSKIWQMPQGGIDEGEDPKTAMFRELEEETGIQANHVEIVAHHNDWLHYDLPEQLIGKAWGGKYRGQKQQWFLLRFLGTKADVDLNHSKHPEFEDWKWLEPQELPNVIVPFKKEVYEEVLTIFAEEISF